MSEFSNDETPETSFTRGDWVAPSLSTSSYDPGSIPVERPLAPQGLFQSYKAVMLNHNLATFDAALPAANWQDTLIGIAIASLGISLMMFFMNLIYNGSSGVGFGAVIGIFIFSFPIVFAAFGVYQIIARLLGGKASFLTYAYAMTLVYAPLFAIEAVASLIPYLGFIIVFALSLYGLFLLVLATKSAHAFTTGKAVATVLIPAGISMLLSCALYSFVFLFLLAVMAGTH